jgi:hypothetical protein
MTPPKRRWRIERSTLGRILICVGAAAGGFLWRGLAGNMPTAVNMLLLFGYPVLIIAGLWLVGRPPSNEDDLGCTANQNDPSS